MAGLAVFGSLLRCRSNGYHCKRLSAAVKQAIKPLPFETPQDESAEQSLDYIHKQSIPTEDFTLYFKREKVLLDVKSKVSDTGECSPQTLISEGQKCIKYHLDKYKGVNPPKDEANVHSVAEPLSLDADTAKKTLAEANLDLNKSSAVQLLDHYKSISKFRLTLTVVGSYAAGYFANPEVVPWSAVAAGTAGTFLLSCGANSLNQFLEAPYDAQMTRTRIRVLVQKRLSPSHVLAFSITSGVTGTALLAFGVNSTTALLGVANYLIYGFIYTPMKRYHILNTWVGALVGAIPPMMGWTTASGAIDFGSIMLGALLFSWQFPHFCALSWSLKQDYTRAGYAMMSVTHPALCGRTAFNHSLYVLGLCSLAFPLTNIGSWTFACATLAPNLYLSYLSYKFKNALDAATARSLFRFSLVHLPVILLLKVFV